MMLLYSLVLSMFFVCSLPYWIFRGITTRRFRAGFGERLGFVPVQLQQAAHGKRVLWLHAVSVGETLAATGLVQALEAMLGPEWLVAVSTTTETGQEIARNRFGAERVFYMPLDFAVPIRQYLDALRPEALVLIESEVWPRLLYEFRQRRLPAIVVNARISDRSFARGLKVRGVWRHVLGMVSLWLAQSDEDGRRLVAMGAPEDRVQVAGNMKYDVTSAQDRPMTAALRQYAGARLVVVAGSTHAEDRVDEEDTIFAAMTSVWAEHPDALLVLAPRHPQRFDHVVSLAKQHGDTLRASEVLAGKSKDANARVVVLDTVGDLASVYSLASVAFVGGSLVWSFGHNPLEPAQFGVPVVMGSSFENFRDIVARMQAADAIAIVNNSSELSGVILQWLGDHAEAQRVGEAGRSVFASENGATQRTAEAIAKMVKP